MKHGFTVFAVLMITMAMPQVAKAYDFSAVAPSGQTLYYQIMGSDSVMVTSPYLSTWTGYTTPAGDLTIPSIVYNGGMYYSVVQVGEGAFRNCKSLTSIELPSSCTIVGDGAFSGCDSLISVSLAEGVMSIGNSAFSYCKGLSSIQIPNSVVSIGTAAFYKCNNLVTVILSVNINVIDAETFSNCIALVDITIPYGVDSICSRAFYGCTNLSSVSIPSTVSFIGARAFSECSSLFSVTIPTAVSYIGDLAFRGVRHIEYHGNASGGRWGAISLNGYIENDFVYTDYSRHYLAAYIGVGGDVSIRQGVDTIGNLAFQNYASLMAVTFPDGVKYIGQDAFSGCSELLEISLPNSIEHIHHYAFKNCIKLESMRIGDSILFVGAEAFCGCTRLTDFFVNNTVPPTLGANAFEEVPLTMVLHIPCGCTDIYATSWNVGCLLMEPPVYTFSAVSIDTMQGNVNIIEAPVSCMDTVGVAMATSDSGYVFASWSDGIHDNPRTITLRCDTAITAYFTPLYNIYDTLIVYDTATDNIVLYDTMYIYINDTTYITMHDTTYVYEQVHDTAYINVLVHDTAIVIDTVLLMEYVPVHDTTVVTDTVTLTEYVPVHDTIYIDIPIHDTTIVMDTMILTQYDTVTNIIVDTLWLTQTDTLWLHDTIVIHDTVYITQEGVVGAEALNAKVYSSQGKLVVERAEGKTVTLYDLSGRVLATRQDYGTEIHFDVPASGTYMIKIGNHAARKVVVIR